MPSPWKKPQAEGHMKKKRTRLPIWTAPTIMKMYGNHGFSACAGVPPRIIIILALFGIASILRTAQALNVGVGSGNLTTSLADGCSRTCESNFCGVAPLLRYGKFCGLGYSGCPGELPCDGLDGCCKIHDQCVQAHNDDYLSQGCNQSFLDCVEAFRASGAPSFDGNTCDTALVADLIYHVIKAALLVGKAIHDP